MACKDKNKEVSGTKMFFFSSSELICMSVKKICQCICNISSMTYTTKSVGKRNKKNWRRGKRQLWWARILPNLYYVFNYNNTPKDGEEMMTELSIIAEQSVNRDTKSAEQNRHQVVMLLCRPTPSARVQTLLSSRDSAPLWQPSQANKVVVGAEKRLE